MAPAGARHAAPWPEVGHFVAPDSAGRWRFGTTPRMEVPPGETPPTLEDVAALVASYDAAVRAFDGLVGDVRAELERRPSHFFTPRTGARNGRPAH